MKPRTEYQMDINTVNYKIKYYTEIIVYFILSVPVSILEGTVSATGKAMNRVVKLL
jgi:hypothetical protein